MEVAIIAGCAFTVLFRMALGPLAMISDSLQPRILSISSRKGLHVDGKASSHGVAMAVRWTPCPGKKSAVRRLGSDVDA